MADEEESGSQEDVGWNLGRQFSLPGDGTTIEQIRELSPMEWRQIRDARESFERFGPAWSQAIAVQLAKGVRASAETLDELAQRAGGRASNASRKRVEGAFWAFVDHVAAWILGSGLKPVLDAELLQVRELIGILADNAHSSRTHMQWLRSHGEGDVRAVCVVGDRWLDVLGLVDATLRLGLVFADAELIEAEASLGEASRLLRRVASDAVWGQPILYKSADPDGALVPDPRGLRLELIDPILRACAIAKRRTTRAAEPRSTNAAVPAARSGLLKVATEPTSSKASSEEENADPPAEDAEVPSDLETLDLRILFDEALTIANETERRWSDALGVAVQRDVDEFCGRAHSILSSIRGDLAGRDSNIRSQGLDPTLPSIPMTTETVGALTFTPTAQQRTTQRGLSLTYAASRVASAMNALQRPTAGRVVDGGTRLELWWMQGSFVELQAAIAQLGRLLVVENGQERSFYLRLARRAWGAGLTEAAALYLLRGLNGASTDPLADAHSVLEEGCRRVLRGESYDLEPLALAVEFCWEELRRESTGNGTDESDEAPE